MTESFLATLVSMSTWLTPMPQHAQGRLVAYGNQSLVEANAAYRGYSLDGFDNRCGVAVMSPSDLGKIVWVRLSETEWIRCLAVDVGARHDFFALVFQKREVAEVPFWLAEHMDFEFSQWGEVAIGLCPPPPDSIAVRYVPYLKFDSSGGLTWREYPAQQRPVSCTGWGADVNYGGAQ